ncbi:MAG: hypothetical protein KDI90_04915 [Alphaproteobacteria bacterium]|nr:hypothetical protein [Alphaproteobacteria bacterium]MCB9975114.1 hypothetical protein [Rhodospirillales bacterium]
MKRFLRVLPMLLAGFAGGAAGSFIFQPSPLFAAQGKGALPANTQPIEIFSPVGRRITYMGPGEIGQGTFLLYNNDQSIRIQMGSYPGTRERSQPLIGLHDEKERLRLLIRLAGREDSPALILKDSYGRDRLVLGLQGPAEEPYIRVMDKNGMVKDLLQPKQ